jgi:hypothetical protein
MLGAILFAQLVTVLPLDDVASDNKPSKGGIGEALRAVLQEDLNAVERKGCKSFWQVAGAWKHSDDALKVWARFIDTRGRVAGTSTATRADKDALLLLNTVEADLLRLCGAPRQTIASVAYRIRPRIRSIETLERWGDARVEPDAERKRRLLQLALDADPTFTPASRELDALEQKLPPRDPSVASAQATALRDAAERWAKRVAEEKDPHKLAEETLRRFADLEKQRRLHTLVAEARAVIARPPPPVPDLGEQLPETALYLLVATSDRLADDDTVLREGQRFMALHPLSDGFVGVRQLVDEALARKKQREEGARKVGAALGALKAEERQDPCRTAEVYDTHHQLADARRAYEACVGDDKPHDKERTALVWVLYHAGDFRAAVTALDQLRVKSPEKWKQIMHLASELPVD